jgi:GT2 family glycosyltransferase
MFGKFQDKKMDQINTKFAIAIPTINRWDLLQETLKKYEKDFPNTYFFIVDNGNQNLKDINKIVPKLECFILVPNTNLGVSKSWNFMFKKAFSYPGYPDYPIKFENVLVLNDDIYLGKTESEIIDFIDNNQFSLATTTLTWCAFIISRETYLRVGPFDEEIFPAYFEDNDYAYRLKLEGIQHSCYEFLNPQNFINSGSIAKDPSLNTNFEKNRRYYISKWGGEPEKEIFKTPFNL